MANNAATYINYFRQLAVTHRALQHDPASESGDSTIGAKRFGRFGAEEVITGLRTKISWPALLIEMYEIRTSGDLVNTPKKTLYGAFSIFDSADPKKASDQEAALSRTESIMRDMLRKIYADHYGPDADLCGRPLGEIDFSALNIVSAGPVFDRQFGWRCEFPFLFNDPEDFSTPPDDGTFIVPPPDVRVLGTDTGKIITDENGSPLEIN